MSALNVPYADIMGWPETFYDYVLRFLSGRALAEKAKT
jgi:hypothetical protein